MEEPKPVRRIVTAENEEGEAVAIHDGPTPDVRTDPARPGYASARIWVTDSTPAKIKGVSETLNFPHTIEPPANGSVCRIVTFPPDATYINTVGGKEVRAFFESMGSPGASTYSPDAFHPYMQKTRTCDFCIVLEGEITLILDTREVDLKEGDVVVQRGTNHSWSNRSDKPCTMVFSQHDAVFGGEGEKI